MKKILSFCCLLFLPAGTSIGQLQSNDSLLAHYPLGVGNAWDYAGGYYFLGSVLYPNWVLVTATRDSLHTNGKHYTVMEQVIYDMWGQQHPGALGVVFHQTFLQRVDSASLNVYRVEQGMNLRADDELLIDSLKAQVDDSIFTNRLWDDILLFIEQLTVEIFGRLRAVRHLYVVNALVGFEFKTAEGLGEFSWGSGGEGEPSFRELRGAIIQGEALGILLRRQPPDLELSVSRLDYNLEVKKHTIYFRNFGTGLTVVDSVKLRNEDKFYSQPGYKGGRYSHTIFSKGPFLVFPKDSIQVDLFILDSTLSQAFQDTFRVFARGINGAKLPEIAIPIAFSPQVGVTESSKDPSPPKANKLSVYPNPSSARVTISYELNRRGKITIHVIDLLGREVAILAGQEMTAGNHTFIWKTNSLSAGIYFLVLATAEERLLQKVHILK